MQELRIPSNFVPSEGVRDQVLEVIVRQALAGAPWRVICAGPMQVNDISEAEVEEYMLFRQKRLKGEESGAPDEARKKVQAFAAEWQKASQPAPIDKEKTRKAVTGFYAALGLEKPAVIYCESPLQMVGFAVAAEVLAEHGQIAQRQVIENPEVQKRFWQQLSDQRDAILEAVKLKGPSILESKAISSRGQLYDAKALREAFRQVPIEYRDTIHGAALSWRRPNSGMLSTQEAIGVIRKAFPGHESLLPAIMRSIFEPTENPPAMRHFVARNVLGFYDAYKDVSFSGMESMYELMVCAWQYAMFESICLVCEPPAEVNQDRLGRANWKNGPAVLWKDGFKIYAVNGFQIPARWIEHPETIELAEIEEQLNAEMRRVMIDLYGAQRYIENSGGELVDEDAFGKLYRKRLENDEDIVMVAVVNCTPEPDGSYKNYWLRVPPNMVTAHEAVAWTFGLEAHLYRPEIET